MRRVSPVPITTFLTCRSPYPERFLSAAYPNSSHLPWSSPNISRLNSSLSSCEVSFDEAAGFTLCYNLLVCSHSLKELLCHRASTLGFLHQLPVSYRALWRLLGLDFHQLAINGLLGTQI